MIRVSQAAHRYGHVLYTLAKKDKLEENVLADLSRLTDLVFKHSDLEKAFRNPLITREDFDNIITSLNKEMTFVPLTYHFLMVLARHRRLSEIKSIRLAYKEELSQGRSELSAVVIASHQLSSAHLNRLEKILLHKTGKTVHLETRVDSSLLGGFILRMKSYMVDASVRTKMNKLKLRLERVA